jgi:hypothetical protein
MSPKTRQEEEMPAPWLDSPYIREPGAQWLTGNLHTHTTASDGEDSPQEMVRRYAALGHDFLMISDHDGITDAGALDPCGMILLPGNEICGGGPHVLDVGARRLIRADGHLQPMLDAIARESGFAILCHPNWEEDFDHYPIDLMLSLRNYVGVEILNGGCIHSVGSHLAVDKWDRVLSSGQRAWGYANDDAHRAARVGLGWNVARARSRTAPAVLDALRGGNFYASCGVRIEDIRCDGSRVWVKAPNADRIAVIGQHGRRIHSVDAPEMTFDAAGVLEPFIRVECHGRAEEAAWTQPLYIRDGEYEALHRRLAEVGAEGKATLQALDADRAPAITGRGDDPLWQHAAVHDRFLNIASGRPAPVRTELRCVRFGNALHFALRCEEPQVDQVAITGGRTTSLWTDDSVEIFLDFEGKALSYGQLVVTASGHTAVGWRGTPQATIEKPVARTAAWAAGGTRGWSVELTVPVVGCALRPGARIGLHVCRNRTPDRGSYVWSWVGGSNHSPARFGSLVL